jgi:hypothetical protein
MKTMTLSQFKALQSLLTELSGIEDFTAATTPGSPRLWLAGNISRESYNELCGFVADCIDGKEG